MREKSYFNHLEVERLHILVCVCVCVCVCEREKSETIKVSFSEKKTEKICEKMKTNIERQNGATDKGERNKDKELERERER